MKPEQIIAKHGARIEQLRRDIANNWDVRVSSQRLINKAFHDMGIERFVGGHDRWEQLVCYLNGWTYHKPPKHLVERWQTA